jgi:putative selenate reductase
LPKYSSTNNCLNIKISFTPKLRIFVDLLEMTDKFTVIPFRQLFRLVLTQLDTNQSFFGIPESVFFKPDRDDHFKLKRFNQQLETPIGVAAGPHTQLAQNIIAAWLCGARYMELKTVQTLDELEVSKPCIDMQDEGYNCEWSQELKIQESYDQYLNAWIILHVLKHKFGWSESSELGAIFNMSVGYDLQGIMQENVQWFFLKMKNCSIEKKQKIKEVCDLYPDIEQIHIPDQISNNITLSTMHGCPPDEIEKIGQYLIQEHKLHTSIKLNPTLLGKAKLNDILKKSGFNTLVPDEAFAHDLKYPEAIRIIKNLQKAAKENKVQFGLKLTNTLESKNHKTVFPKTEKMMYMSGRALHPISINLARKIQQEFNGTLDVSFSAGVNALNIHEVIKCGLMPATVCSDILKPGGYGLLKQYLDNLSAEIEKSGAKNISDYISDQKLQNLQEYAEKVKNIDDYKRTAFVEPNIKTDRKLGKFDCIHAPCVDTCPTNQDIPEYMHFVANGELNKAFNVIMQMNPFPNTTGMVCDHLCQLKCTRIHYDDSLQIREIKRFVAENGHPTITQTQTKPNGLKVAIIGAGPSGLSAAYFLALAGFEANVYEMKDQPGGMVSGAIPSFRLTNEAFRQDIRMIEGLGVKIHFNIHITQQFIQQLKTENDYTYIATGAQKSKKFEIAGIDAKGVLDPLKFLFDVKSGNKTGIGKNVAIIGGGNTAMDAARTAYRLVGKDGKVTILYRRTIKEMPADQGEIKAVLEEGMELKELVLPTNVITEKGKVQALQCIKMKLQNIDNSGRPKPVKISDSEFELPFDTIIPAIGQDLDIDFVDTELLQSQAGVYETKIPGVLIGGDALRGASTAINAIGDGRKAAEIIIKKSGLNPGNPPTEIKYPDEISIMQKRMLKQRALKPQETSLDNRKNFNLVSTTLNREHAMKEASRCLLCHEICNTCVTVCPNMALYPYKVKPAQYQLQKIITKNGALEIALDTIYEIKQKNQILHIADWCNECGNCTTFCPTSGSPYKEKPHLYLNREAFEKDDHCYYYDRKNKNLMHKTKGHLHQLKEMGSEFIYKWDNAQLVLDKESLNIKYDDSINEENFNLKIAAEMSVILEGVINLYGTQKAQTKRK